MGSDFFVMKKIVWVNNLSIYIKMAKWLEVATSLIGITQTHYTLSGTHKAFLLSGLNGES